jgi:hypothetical protein
LPGVYIQQPRIQIAVSFLCNCAQSEHCHNNKTVTALGPTSLALNLSPLARNILYLWELTGSCLLYPPNLQLFAQLMTVAIKKKQEQTFDLSPL